jgi:protein-tyrosine phosphatase
MALRGTWNVRHVGGYAAAAGRIAERLLWRGDALHAIDGDGRRMLAALPLRTVVDLRDDGERDRMPDRLEGVEAQVIHIPMRITALVFDRRADLAAWRRGDLGGFFELLAQARAAEIAEAVAALARPGALPALIHCTAGKDRTGMVVAVLLSALGVADEDVAADFALSSRYLDLRFAEHARRAMATPVDAGASDRVFVDAAPEWIRGALECVREEHGDAAGYLRAHGTGPAALAALRSALVI